MEHVYLHLSSYFIICHFADQSRHEFAFDVADVAAAVAQYLAAVSQTAGSTKCCLNKAVICIYVDVYLCICESLYL